MKVSYYIYMTDEEINKLASKLTKSLASKEDLESLATKDDIKEVKKDIKRLEQKIDDVDKKADSILVFAEEVDKVTVDHEERLKGIESVPVVAHHVKK